MSAPRIVWQPVPGRNGFPSSQQLALASRANEVLYEGSRGPGKTDTQLMDFRKLVGSGYGRFWRGILFDRQYKNLDDIISKSLRWFPQFNDGAKFIQGGGLRWEWPTGEALLFRHLKRTSDYHNYHGHEYPWIGWNELTKQPTSELYDMMRSCNRTSFVPHLHSPPGTELPEILLRVFSTTNPHGPGHSWVKRHWCIGEVNPGVTIRDTRTVFNPRTQRDEIVTRTKVRFFGSYRENVFLTPEYVAELDSIKDPNKKRAWLLGDWDIEVGGAFEGVWSPTHQKLPCFKVPSSWRLTRSFDWGSTHPFSVGWWARSNGEEVRISSTKSVCLPAGSLVRVFEWYGTEEIGTNRGLKLPARKVARGILERESRARELGWVEGPVSPGPADGQIYAVNETESLSIAAIMAGEGVEWYAADKRPGSRKTGLELVRGALDAACSNEGPGLYYMDRCVAFSETMKSLPRDEDDPDDVDTTAEDHPYDETRYMVLDRADEFVRNIDVKFTR